MFMQYCTGLENIEHLVRNRTPVKKKHCKAKQNGLGEEYGPTNWLHNIQLQLAKKVSCHL